MESYMTKQQLRNLAFSTLKIYLPRNMKLTLIFLLSLSINLGISDGSYYELLGVSTTATQQEIRQAYKKLAVKYHPDKSPNESDQLKFLEISEAYETLKNPWKRRSYDYSGHTQSSSQNNQDLLYNGLYKHDPYVVTITPEEFDSFLSSGFHFVNFYSPFCPPCQKLVKHWKALAEAYHGIVKFGAVNCKYHSAFCYNAKRINSYPSLFFYPEGSSGSYIYYSGGRSYDEISSFLTSQLSAIAPLATTTRLTITPALYVLKRDIFSEEALVRLRYKLKDILPILLLSSGTTSKWGDEVTCVISLSHNIELTSDNEPDVISAVEQHLPNFTNVTQDMFTKIRSDLRIKSANPWVLYLTDGPLDRLTLHRVNHTLKHTNIGVIECTSEKALCVSLHTSPPQWGVVHVGGAYSHVSDASHLVHRVYLRNVHVLSHTEVDRIVNDGDTNDWIVLTVPDWSKQNYDQLVTKLAQHFHYMQVGMWRCSRDNKDCNNRIHVRILKKTYSNPGPADFQKILEFVNLIRDTPRLDLDEDKVLEVMQGTNEQTWVLVMTSASDHHADTLVHQWRLAAKKLTSFTELNIGVLRCTSNSGLCSNIRNSVVRYYPPKSTFTHAVSAAELTSWGYMCEWVLSRHAPVDYMSFNSFTKQVLSDQLHSESSRSWLIYFHSPRCHSCYLNYADFVITGQRLKPAVRVAKVNCLVERDLCHREHIHSYPSLRLYLSSRHRSFLIHSIQIEHYDTLVKRIESLILSYDKSLLNGLEGYSHIVHDEF